MNSVCETQFNLLKILSDANPKLRNAILIHSSPELIDAISEICYNYLLGNIKCEKKQYNILKKHSTCIRKLAEKSKAKKNTSRLYRREIADKRKILMMQGNGFFLSLFIPLLTELGMYLGNKFLNN